MKKKIMPKHTARTINCPECGEICFSWRAMCIACGANLNPEEPNEQDSTKETTQGAMLTSCLECGHKISKRACICPQCGAVQSQKCSICSNSIPISSITCPQCGDPEPFSSQHDTLSVGQDSTAKVIQQRQNTEVKSERSDSMMEVDGPPDTEYIPVEQFAKLTGETEQGAIEGIKKDYYEGKRDGGEWLIKSSMVSLPIYSSSFSKIINVAKPCPKTQNDKDTKYISVAQFARETSQTEQEVLDGNRAGYYSGLLRNNTWVIKADMVSIQPYSKYLQYLQAKANIMVPNLAPEFNLSWFLFSFDGRIGRQSFWCAYPIIFFLGLALSVSGEFIKESQNMTGLFIIVVLTFLLLWPSLAIQVKRWHDRNKSGNWVLLNLIPIVGSMWVIIELGFLKGTEGNNVYGDDPLSK
ncbi:zinc-ribbon domain-containing protein [Desulfogranum marinum]|uniref:zinc-ribbon domain-containing protein n=1 Tax=Desulfogranum marinum TaxID=453220 RepID=UPI0019665E1B|nr:zinc-ribbon domain-containing protein [Desulfogranum marinum]MBM9514724.1 zinc-ribbon domain-containing protein [Desulfogranum marinum]